ncbi:MAG: hypothetical protein ACI81P_001959 [Neolewinella sp.]
MGAGAGAEKVIGAGGGCRHSLETTSTSMAAVNPPPRAAANSCKDRFMMVYFAIPEVVKIHFVGWFLMVCKSTPASFTSV